jgi:hypothetical protein
VCTLKWLAIEKETKDSKKKENGGSKAIRLVDEMRLRLHGASGTWAAFSIAFRTSYLASFGMQMQCSVANCCYHMTLLN